jgi:hypothetical protein
MLLNPIDQLYENQKEPYYSTFHFLRNFILKNNIEITEAFKYGTPFFIYKKKNLAYLWIDKKTKLVYIGFPNGKLVEHNALYAGDKKYVKKYFVNQDADIDIQEINSIITAFIKALDSL